MAITLAKLGLAELDQFKGGLIQRMGDKNLERVAQDLLAAPEIDEWRVVTLKLKFKPTAEEGQLADVRFEFECPQPKLPSRVTSGTMKVQSDKMGRKGFYHNIDSPDVPAQESFLPPPERVAA